MPLSLVVSIIQIVVCVLLAVAILLQQRGGSAGGAFGGAGASYFTRRGLEKVLFIATVILGILFTGLTITSLLIK